MKTCMVDEGAIGKRRLARLENIPVVEVVSLIGSVVDCSEEDTSMKTIQLQNREYISTIRENREPDSSVARILPAMETSLGLEQVPGQNQDAMNFHGHF